ncbi:DNA polymerase III subunit beta family protein [Bradyrhizobium sp. WSM471]|uniref:DNA polymerase III subunit beta family protein n=1 Tax=Bradyrhizobium sp. WSM471 TaxID=319017 RepID=UPI00024D1A4D|nr:MULTISPECIES: DNA polymerase sliding clamp subunit [Bradyrhizobium]EHQ99493.1 DNA polymerase sliding clamp subunit [Bradyrhizobium sp. WSM471]UFW41657.1 hypothetical protein BcanWSM471_00090 [Bradyrhizobium canariense]
MAGRVKARSGSLAAALGLATLPVGERQTPRVPVMEAVRLAADRESLAITTTTFECTITIWAEAAAEGELALPLEPLAALLRHFPPNTEIAITADDHAAMLTVGQSSFKLPVVPIANLREPLLMGVETGRVELDAKTTLGLFARPAFAAAHDASRGYLNGILLHSTTESLVAVAADGVRYCRVTTPAATTLSPDRSLIIANGVVNSISRLLRKAIGNATLRRSERLFAVEGACERMRFAVVSRRIDATYPAYERFCQLPGPNFITTHRAGLAEALARFTAVAAPQTSLPVVKVSWDAGGLHLCADGSHDHLEADVVGESETAVQTRCFAEIVGALRGDNVTINARQPSSIILITDPDDESFAAGLMPIRPRSS